MPDSDVIDGMTAMDVNQERFVRLPGNEEILPVVAAVVSRVKMMMILSLV